VALDCCNRAQGYGTTADLVSQFAVGSSRAIFGSAEQKYGPKQQRPPQDGIKGADQYVCVWVSGRRPINTFRLGGPGLQLSQAA